MELFLKNTHTLIGSWISNITSNITPIKPKGQWGKLQGLIAFSFFLLLPTTNYQPFTTHAIVDPLAVSNNRFGIHIISATPDEIIPAASLVNSSDGDWGYVTVLIESRDRNKDKWQAVFDEFRRRHLIPLVRLATKPVNGDFWERPYEKEEEAWADFLDNLNWPTKNRYVIVYNEPNQAKEWGNFVDPKNYAEVLDRTITALKNKNRDFFVLNSGFDASAPHQPPKFYDEEKFLTEMNQAVPRIFDRLDGWVCHCYPNPGFIGSPEDLGRGSLNGWLWEIQTLKKLGITKSFPIFITETGWKHAEGLVYDSALPNSDTVAEYYRQTFEKAFNVNRIAAVTPFLLNYQETPFDHFSFKKITGEKQHEKILGISYPEYYPQFETLVNLTKTKGQPVQEIKARLKHAEIYYSTTTGEYYNIPITLKNTGQSIWNDRGGFKLMVTSPSQEFNFQLIELPFDQRIEPGQEQTFYVKFQSYQPGIYRIYLNPLEGNNQFDSTPLRLTVEVKSLASLLSRLFNPQVLWEMLLVPRSKPF